MQTARLQPPAFPSAYKYDPLPTHFLDGKSKHHHQSSVEYEQEAAPNEGKSARTIYETRRGAECMYRAKAGGGRSNRLVAINRTAAASHTQQVEGGSLFSVRS